MLPPEVRTELKHRMIDAAFSGYQQLAKEFRAQGSNASADSLQRYGAKLQRRLEAIELAEHRATLLPETAPDGGETMIKATLRLLRVRLFSLLAELEQLEHGDMVRLDRTVTQLDRLTAAFGQCADKVKPRQTAVKRQAKTTSGLSTEVYNTIRNALLAKQTN
jgi:hypothetical protein